MTDNNSNSSNNQQGNNNSSNSSSQSSQNDRPTVINNDKGEKPQALSWKPVETKSQG